VRRARRAGKKEKEKTEKEGKIKGKRTVKGKRRKK